MHATTAAAPMPVSDSIGDIDDLIFSDSDYQVSQR